MVAGGPEECLQAGDPGYAAEASRPADAVPLIGWDRTGLDALIIAAVLRSWEERFDARLLRA